MSRWDVHKMLIAHAKSVGCRACGIRDPMVLDFHHREPEDKHFSIGELKSVGPSVPRLLSELAKCDVLCSNCHRRLEWFTSRLR